MSLLNAIRDFHSQYGTNKKYWLAFSGGLDSHVLLSLFCRLRAELDIDFCAIHINHGLSPNAKHWANHCKSICNSYGIEYVEHAIQLDLKIGDSVEEQARVKRYAVFADGLGAGDILLTAHQQDDQAETVILQLLRGAGPRGLAAMPVIKSFAKGFHGRPLLGFSRVDLERYADSQQLEWIDDESNDNVALTRNFIRHEILSRLKLRWPTITSTISRSAAHCAETQILLNEFAHEINTQVHGRYAHTLSVTKLIQLSQEKQRLMLRTWIYQCGYPIPNTKIIGIIQRDIFTAAWDRNPCVSWGSIELRRYRDDLYLMPSLQKLNGQHVFTWDLDGCLRLPGVGVLYASPVRGHGLRADIKHVSVQYRQGGEVVKLANRGRHTLKNLFQEWNVLPWDRSRVPLIFVADRLVAVVGYCIDENFVAEGDEMGREFLLKKSR